MEWSPHLARGSVDTRPVATSVGQRGSISPALFAEDSTDYRPSSPPPGPPCSRIQAVALPPCRSRVDRCTDGRIASKNSLPPWLSLPSSFTSLCFLLLKESLVSFSYFEHIYYFSTRFLIYFFFKSCFGGFYFDVHITVFQIPLPGAKKDVVFCLPRGGDVCEFDFSVSVEIASCGVDGIRSSFYCLLSPLSGVVHMLCVKPWVVRCFLFFFPLLSPDVLKCCPKEKVGKYSF